MMVLAIIAITTGLAAPAFNTLLKEHRSEQVIRQLYGLIQKSRHHAITNNTNIILCKSRDFVSCGGSWSDGIIVFADTDGNRSVNGRETLLQAAEKPFDQGTLFWRSFGNKSHLEFLPTGITNYQNGTFTYCIDRSDLKQARGISITVTGRPQIAIDRNGDGVRENSGGKPLRC